MSETLAQRLVVGITGGSGAILGIRLLELLRKTPWEVHLVVTETAEKVIEHETPCRVGELAELASHVHQSDDMFAPIASGSFRTAGMVVIPCSMKTLAAIASGHSDNLVLRAADVSLKERRRLILVTRETPLSLIHLDNMRKVTLAGATVTPPVLAMYARPTSVEEMIDQVVGKVLDQLGVDSESYRRWG